MSLTEDLKTKQAELAALKDRIEADDAEAIAEGEKLRADIEAKTAEIEQARKKAALLTVIGTKKEEDTIMSEVKATNLGDAFIDHLKANPAGARFDVVAPEFKAYNDVQKTPTTSGVSAYATTYDRTVVEAARTPLVVRDLFGAETISGSTLVYLVEGAIEGAPAATNEGAKKPQVHFADPTPKTVSLAKIACHIKESDEYVNDYAFLASAINGRLLYQHGLTVQNKLIYDLCNTSGIQSDDDTWTSSSTAAALADLILKGAMDVQEESGFAADGIIINPTDWYNLRIAKDGEYRYYGGGFFGSQNVPNLWGIPVCVSTAVSAGTIIVGAFKTCASVVTNGGVRVEATNTDQDDFVKNLMTIRCEERLALAVRRPKGFMLLEKAAGGATGQ